MVAPNLRRPSCGYARAMVDDPHEWRAAWHRWWILALGVLQVILLVQLAEVIGEGRLFSAGGTSLAALTVVGFANLFWLAVRHRLPRMHAVTLGARQVLGGVHVLWGGSVLVLGFAWIAAPADGSAALLGLGGVGGGWFIAFLGAFLVWLTPARYGAMMAWKDNPDWVAAGRRRLWEIQTGGVTLMLTAGAILGVLRGTLSGAVFALPMITATVVGVLLAVDRQRGTVAEIEQRA